MHSGFYSLVSLLVSGLVRRRRDLSALDSADWLRTLHRKKLIEETVSTATAERLEISL